MDLQGQWRFCTEDNSDFALPDFDDSAWKMKSIPANWFLGGLDHHGVVWFRHEFRQRRREEFASLRFDGVDYFADAYLNGEHLTLACTWAQGGGSRAPLDPTNRTGHSRIIRMPKLKKGGPRKSIRSP
jgi:hypothetical protein